MSLSVSVSQCLSVCVSVCLCVREASRGAREVPRAIGKVPREVRRGPRVVKTGPREFSCRFVSFFVVFCRFLSISALVGRFLHSWTPLGLSWRLPDRSWGRPDLSRTAPRVDVGAIQLLPPPLIRAHRSVRATGGVSVSRLRSVGASQYLRDSRTDSESRAVTVCVCVSVCDTDRQTHCQSDTQCVRLCA